MRRLYPIYDRIINQVKLANSLNSEKNEKYGLVLNLNFFERGGHVCAQTPYLIDKIIDEFDPVIIPSQRTYDKYKDSLEYVISMVPGWDAPKITYNPEHIVGIFVSDPHKSKHWVEDYVYENDIDFVFSYYYHPFLEHMPDFDRDRLIHFPWAMPKEHLVDPAKIRFNDDESIHLFGASGGDAYDVRDWCRSFEFVKSHDNSGVQNPVMTDEEYFQWLTNFDAMIAAGSLSKTYQLVTPKYFEIAGAGSLLFAQYCEDLDLLGFDSSNCLVFGRNDFQEQAEDYLSSPESYLEKRRRGCELIWERHTIDQRIKTLKQTIGINNG